MLKKVPIFRVAGLFKSFRCSFATIDAKTPAATETTAGDQVAEVDELPVHLRPYEKSKYEVASTKIKYASGYSLLEVEPFPRAKIMKLGYIILEKLKEIPAEALYRIYTEEKFKYIMKLVDETEDIRTLEEKFGYDSIEMFIQILHDELELFRHLKDSKPWEAREIDEEELTHFSKVPRANLRHTRHDRPAREEKKFISP